MCFPFIVHFLASQSQYFFKAPSAYYLSTITLNFQNFPTLAQKKINLSQTFLSWKKTPQFFQF